MKNLRRGFGLLKTRPLSDKLDVEALESEHGIAVPTKYKLFAQLFYLTFHDTLDRSGIQYLPDKSPMDGEIYFDDLFPLSFSLATYRENEFWASKGLTQIGGGPPNGGILLSLARDNLDSIFYNNGHRYVKLADNVFDFFRDVVVYDSMNDQVEKFEL